MGAAAALARVALRICHDVICHARDASRETLMIDHWRRALSVFVLGLAAPLAGCTTILGDFSSSDASTGDPGSDAAGSSGSPGIGDSAAAPDVSALDDAGSAGDAPSTVDSPDAAKGCGAGQLTCSAGCVSANDLHTCGSCVDDCTLLPHVAAQGLACNAGVCTYTCLPGYAHCSSNPSDVCETDLSATGHCGTCSTVCSGDTPVCAAQGQGYACASGCMAGTTECSGSCANLTSDDGHCGSCTNACTGGTKCQSSACACTPPQTSCGGTCYSTADDATHCGAACIDCTPPPAGTGRATCTGGTCGSTCNAGFSACGGATPCAYDTSSDNAHCGPNCMDCGSGMVCSGGSCVCGGGAYQVCNGVCTNTNSDAKNCGSCGVSCAAGCSGGSCNVACTPVRCGTSNCGCDGLCCGKLCC